jgi:hypothetical protein
MSVEHYLLRSKDRFSGTSNNFKLKTKIGKIVGKYKITHISFPNTIYNVTSSNNSVDYNSGTFLTLPVGYYNSSNLPAAVKKMLDDAPPADTYTVTISATTGKMTITSNTATNFSLSLVNGLDKILGFDPSQFPLSGTSSYTGNNIINYDIVVSIGVDIKESTYHNLENMADDSFSSSIYVPLDGNFGDYVTISDKNDIEQFVYFEKQYRTLNVSLINLSDLTPIDLNGAEFELVLKRVSC